MHCIKGEGIIFSSTQEVISAYPDGASWLYMQELNVRLPHGAIVETTVGRVILFEALPEGSDFHWVNKIMKKSDLTKLVEKIYYRFGNQCYGYMS